VATPRSSHCHPTIARFDKAAAAAVLAPKLAGYTDSAFPSTIGRIRREDVLHATSRRRPPDDIYT